MNRSTYNFCFVLKCTKFLVILPKYQVLYKHRMLELEEVLSDPQSICLLQKLKIKDVRKKVKLLWYTKT